MRVLFLFIVALMFTSCGSFAKPEWKDGIQTYTFHKFTLVEALNKTNELGLNYAEAYFGQTLGEGFADSLYLDYNLDESLQQQIKELFKKNGVELYSLGVAMYSTAQEWELFFDFANKMGVKIISCEPKLEQLDFVEQLALKYNIKAAIHNHPGGSVYADSDVLLKALDGRSDAIGVCADPGHWKRMGKDPVQVLKQFKGKIKAIHLKDLNADMEDTVWGTGVLAVNEIVKELEAQKFNGLVAVEFENFNDNQMNDIKKSLEYYKSIN